MAQALFEAFKPPVKKPCVLSDIALIPSGGGVFEVALEGRTIFSKKAEGRFPEFEEIRAEIARRVG